jgi:hypothetical protein
MIDKLQDQLVHGLGSDLELAYYNRNILLQLRMIHPKITEQTSKAAIEQFNFMCVNSKINAVLYLSRIYDKPNNNNKTRCLEKLINQLISNKMSNAPVIIAEILWEEFKIKHLKALHFLGANIVKSDDFLAKVGCYITTTRESNGAPLNKVKEWRDGFIAHNDSNKDAPSLSDIQIEELLIIAEAALSYINDFLGIGASFNLRKPAGEFVDEIFSQLITVNKN